MISKLLSPLGVLCSNRPLTFHQVGTEGILHVSVRPPRICTYIFIGRSVTSFRDWNLHPKVHVQATHTTKKAPARC